MSRILTLLLALPCALRYYRAIPEFIAGYGALLLTDA